MCALFPWGITQWLFWVMEGGPICLERKKNKKIKGKRKSSFGID